MPNGVKDRLTGPAIGLIVTGALNALCGLLFTLSGIVQLAAGARRPSFGSHEEEAGYYMGTIAVIVCSVISIFVCPVIIYGATQMMRVRKYGLSKAGAILAMIPCTSVCCLAGLPLGIWAVVTLNKPEIRAAFEAPPPLWSPPPPAPPPTSPY